MKTAMQELIDWINSDYRTQIEVETKAKELLKLEIQQIKDAWCDGDDNGYGNNCNRYIIETFVECQNQKLNKERKVWQGKNIAFNVCSFAKAGQ